MTSKLSDRSKISLKSQVILEDVARKSTTKIFRIQGEFDDETLRLAWNAFGLYCSRQLRMGRGVLVPKFGLLTFTAPEVKLEGVTNPHKRDQQPRMPVFIISKEFAASRNIESGIIGVDGSVRPYKACGTNGAISQTKVNFTEIGIYSELGKDDSKLCIERVMKQLSEKASKSENVEMEIPNVGVFFIRNHVAAIRFNDYLVNDTRVVSKKSVCEKKQRGEMTLTKDNMRRFCQSRDAESRYSQRADDFLELDDKAVACLQREFNITLDKRAQSVTNLLVKSKLQNARPLSSSHFSRPVRTLQSIPYKLLIQWIRANNLNSSDAFNEIIKAARLSCDSDCISNDQLLEAMKNLNIIVTATQCNDLFRVLDHDKDGWVGQQDWNKVVAEEGNPFVEQIKNRIKRMKMAKSDVFERMGINNEIQILNLLSLKDAIKLFEPAYSDQAAYDIAKYLLQSDETITLASLAFQLECDDNDDDQIITDLATQTNGYDTNIINRIRQFLIDNRNPNCLKQQFAAYDINNKNVLSFPSFRAAFLKLDIGLTMNEIARLARQCVKDHNGLILYHSLLDELQRASTNSEQKFFVDLEDFVGQLKKFMTQNAISKAEELISKLINADKCQFQDKGVKLTTFITLLQKFAFPQSTEAEILPYANVIDIDGDGWIQSLDIQTFLDCNGYMLQHLKDQHKSTNLSLTISAFEHKRQLNEPLRESLFPTKPLNFKELEKVMRDLRQKLYLKKISNYEFFKLLDLNQDGFITIQEFQSAMGKLIALNKETLDGLFAYMDQQKIGMIDYQSLLYVMNYNFDAGEETRAKPDDNWNWPYNIMERIKRWAAAERLRVEDAFRVLDHDFDGFISKPDLNIFVLEVLKVPDKEVTASRINRLFKLLDQYKRGQLQVIDIRRLLNNQESEVIKDTTITGGRSLVGKNEFDWKLNAKQQIGIVISRLYGNLKDSYSTITTQAPRMTYKQFAKWVEDKRVLIGFDLTDQLLQQVFSEIDPHKKGYVTLDDWLNAFAGYTWEEQMFKEVQQQISFTFNDLRQAYVYFSGGIQTKLTFEAFEGHLNSLFPNRFSYSDISSLWKKISDFKQWIDYNRFCLIFEQKNKRPKTAGMVQKKQAGGQTVDVITNIHGQKQSPEEMCEQIVFKLRGILKASNQNLKEVFASLDADGSGKLSNLEFKNALRQMNLGLTSKEIDMLLNYIDESGDGMINWEEFSKKLESSVSSQLITKRCKSRLSELNNHLHHYLLSPKDAFRQFDTSRVGYMTFPQFCKLMDRVCQMANEPLPAFSIMKDMFEYVDIRGDGVIDEKEWVQTFGQFDPPETIMKEQGESRQMERKKKKTAKLDYFTSEEKNEIEEKNFATGSKAAAYFESTSKDYDKVMKVLGRNRKYLLDAFNKIAKTQGVTYEVAQETLQKMFQSLGLRIDSSCYPLLLRFAEKDGVIDYKFMLDVYKERAGRIDGQPNLE